MVSTYSLFMYTHSCSCCNHPITIIVCSMTGCSGTVHCRSIWLDYASVFIIVMLLQLYVLVPQYTQESTHSFKLQTPPDVAAEISHPDDTRPDETGESATAHVIKMQQKYTYVVLHLHFIEFHLRCIAMTLHCLSCFTMVMLIKCNKTQRKCDSI